MEICAFELKNIYLNLETKLKLNENMKRLSSPVDVYVRGGYGYMVHMIGGWSP